MLSKVDSMTGFAILRSATNVTETTSNNYNENMAVLQNFRSNLCKSGPCDALLHVYGLFDTTDSEKWMRKIPEMMLEQNEIE